MVVMRKLFSAFSFFVAGGLYFAFASVISAQSICPTGQFENLCKLKIEDDTPIFSNVITILLAVAVLFALIFLIWGSIRWVTSGGDKGKVDEARKAVVASIIGLILAFSAFFILSIVTFLFTGHSITTFVLPTIVP